MPLETHIASTKSRSYRSFKHGNVELQVVASAPDSDGYSQEDYDYNVLAPVTVTNELGLSTTILRVAIICNINIIRQHYTSKHKN